MVQLLFQRAEEPLHASVLPRATDLCTAANDSCIETYDRAERGEYIFGGVIAAVSVIDPKGRETTIRYNPKGTAATQNNELGQPSNFKRDSVGRIIETTDVFGRTMKYAYDANGNMNQSTDALGRITNISFDPVWNKPTAVTRYLSTTGTGTTGTSITSRMTYDPTTGNLLTAIDPLGNTTRYTYNSVGQVTEITNPLNHKTKLTYNAAGDLIKTTDALNNEIVMEPDLAGRINKITDPLQYVTRIERNGLDQTTKIIDADLGETKMAYDAKHQLASVTDPLNQVVEQYNYDDLTRPTTRTDASGQTESTQYDPNGLVTRHTDRKGQITSQSYDDKDRPVTTDYADGSSITRSYDAVGRLIKLVRSGAGLSETFTYQLDDVDRLTQLVRTAGSRTDTLSYQYDTLNRITNRVANGEATAYTYDNAGRINTISHKGQITTYTWDAASRLTQKTLPNNIKQQMVYDDAGRLTSLIYKSNTNTVIEQIDYQYDARGQRTSMTTVGSYPVARDTPITATYNAANRLATLTLKGAGQNNADETYAFSYDNNGNLTEKRGQGAIAGNVTTYSWDKQNRLTGMTQAGQPNTNPNPTLGNNASDNITATFSYDQFGRRTNKTISINGQANDVSYVYDGDQAVGETSSTANTSQLTGLAIDEHIARYTGQEQLVYLTDALGSIIAQTKADGSFQNKYGYSPYGQVKSDADDKGNPHQYTGRENDGTGLLFYRARYYMPSCGRFISEDPIGIRGGLNIYAYVRGNPVSMSDPSGLRPLTNCEIWTLSPYADLIDLLNADLHDGEVPFYLQDGFAGITRGNNIYFRPNIYDAKTPDGLAILAHELLHVKQYREGMNLLSYAVANRNGYRNNKFEVPAYELQSRVQRELTNEYGNEPICP